MCNVKTGKQPHRVSISSLQGGKVPKAAEDGGICWQRPTLVVGGEAEIHATSGGVPETVGGM